MAGHSLSGETRIGWRRQDFWYVILLLVVTAVPYCQVVSFDFVSLDDQQYVTESPLVQQGLNPIALWNALTRFHADNWHPLVWWSLMLDFQLFGNNPAPYHVENVLWHALNTVILFAAFVKMTEDRVRSVLVAAVFAVHPLHVESVAWVTERKDVLSGFFWMLGLYLYVDWSKAKHSTGLWLSVSICLLLGLMAKQTVVTLPCVFLLLDFWPLRRISLGDPNRFTWVLVWQLVFEKLPWFGMSLGASCLAMCAQQSARFAAEAWPLSLRLSNAFVGVFRYLGKAAYPLGLSIQYPFDSPQWPVLALTGLIAVTIVVSALSWRWPAPFVGWFWFLGTLAPVSGIIQVGTQSMADRYMYLPLIGLAILVVWSIPSPRTPVMKTVVMAFAGSYMLACMILSTQQTAVWHNSQMLYDHAVAVNPTNENAHYAIGFRAFEENNISDGLRHLEIAVECDRKRWQARLDFAGHQDPRRIKELNRRWSEIYLTLGRAEASEKRLSKAIDDFRKAVEISPSNHDARMVLGMALADAGDNQGALAQFAEILKRSPQYAPAATAYAVLQQSADGKQPNAE